MHAGSLIMYRVLKVDREQSKVNIIQLSKTIMLTSITWNKENLQDHILNHLKQRFWIKSKLTLIIKDKYKEDILK